MCIGEKGVMMLKGIPAVLSPELLKILAEMGHGDTIVIGDANFASASIAKDCQFVRADGVSAAVMTDAILQLMPLDGWADSSVTVMGYEADNGNLQPLEMCQTILAIIENYDKKAVETHKLVDRFEFYENAKKAYAVLATGAENHYGCIILQKGVL